MRTAGEQAIQIQRAAGFRSGPRQTFAAKRLHADHGANHIAVNVQVADFGAAGDLSDGLIDAGMDAEGQTVAGGVNLLDQLIQSVTVIANHVQHRAKDLFFQLIKALELDQGRRNEGPALPLTRILAVFPYRLEHRAALGAQALNMAFNILFRFGIDDRTNVGGQTARVAHPAFAHRAAQHGQRMVGDLFLQAEYTQGGTALPGAIKRRGQHVDHHLLGEGGGVDDHGVHPAGFSDKRRRATLCIQAAGDVALQQRGDFG